MSQNAADDHRTGIDSTVPHSARFWNYLLGGKENYEVDREIGDYVREHFPRMVTVARESRLFLGRAVRYAVEQEGIRQFLDVGTGLPTADNTHEIAQRCAPEARIVYVDNDPLDLVHARALLTSSPEGATNYVHADVREPAVILREAAATLDFAQPIGLVLMGVLGHVADTDEAARIVAELLEALPPGSVLVHYEGTDTHEEMVAANDQYATSGAIPYVVRTPDQVRELFRDLELVEPGVVPVSLWRPEVDDPRADVDGYGGVGRKPAPGND
ncbi:MAG: SAM-dependent methyltransferase [Saccharopolyspora sp.]|uniref:SAM-dependent methyltransferase n=1 Tax=Saccharopolyspora sp. TaxID=33915 RepID=UPI0025EDE16E|nr:SAM-dependent methyltransferase [Saccharopolyspora sp.]MBQ6642067.1 SAM-dependent methyltransferase [Saccharopolyspora sp.]